MTRAAALVVADLMAVSREASRYGPTPGAARQYRDLRTWILQHPAEVDGLSAAGEPQPTIAALVRDSDFDRFLRHGFDRLERLVAGGRGIGQPQG